MKLYHAPGTRSVRIVWLLEELGLSYELELHKLGDPAMRLPEYLKIHPMGRVPALEDGDVTIFESGAIVEYLIGRHSDGKMAPGPASPHYAEYLQWLHYAEGMIMPQVNIIVVETVFLPPERMNQTNVDRAKKLLARTLTAVEAHMEDREFIAGDFSGADVMTGHACTVATRRLGEDASGLPNVTAYVERLNARPALKKAWETGA
ncbi:MAG: glutathione S-transferase family protein [Alphaproteobacteria bacterium]|nr:glutathione S-transferase family protein [Alphaproteobacteria bacterium]